MFSKEQINQREQNFKTLGLGFETADFYRPIVREDLVDNASEGFGLSAVEMVELHGHYGNNGKMRVRLITVYDKSRGRDLYQVTGIEEEPVTEKHLIDAGLKKQEGTIVFVDSDTRVAKLDSKNR